MRDGFIASWGIEKSRSSGDFSMLTIQPAVCGVVVS